MDDNVIQGLIEAGAPPAVIEQARSQMTNDDEAPFEVFEDNWLSFNLFCEMESQWEIIAGMGSAHYGGIKYPSLEAAMRMRRIPPADRAGLYQDVRLMEKAAKSVLNDK